MIPLCVIVRHGNTFAPGEEPRRIGAATDLPLVESGRQQATRLGEYFDAKGWRFDRILCGPLTRTTETAERIASMLSASPAVDPCGWLAEIDHGPDENQPEAIVTARLGRDALDAWDRKGIAPPGWLVDADARLTAWQNLFRDRPAGKTLIVTSNGAARFALLADTRLAEQSRTLSSLKLATGAFGAIALEETGPRLMAWNRRP
jgi:broad specificity phosphatase PhoE